MVIPYGPFRFLPALWLARNRIGNQSWETVPDKDRKPTFYGGFLVTYENGPMWLGAAVIDEMRHTHPGHGAGVASDFTGLTWGASGKYNNGRFFLNLEYVWATQDTNRIGFAQTNAELYNAFAEGGAMCGPGKLSLMWAQSSGPVLNNGNATKVFAANPINYQALEPYSYLMFPIYGGGNDTFHPDGTGQMGDGMALAARLDYAVAANLNLFGTYMWARRLETAGYWAGGKIASVNSADGLTLAQPASTTAASAAAWKSAALGGGFANLNPYPDDNFIGWEAQLGVDWKLLEGMSWQTKYAYWQVGPWFDTAYRAFAPNTAIGQQGQGLYYGRDAIHAIHSALTINF